MADYEVRIGSPEDAAKLRADLADLTPVLAFAGGQTVDQAHKAFREQKLGDTKWPVRYPKQSGPFLNIAPVVWKAGMSKEPGPDDFRQSPALEGTMGDLYKRTGWKVVGKDTVEVGHPEEWSGRFQWGGIGRIPITDTTRKTLAKWLLTAKGTPSNKVVTFYKRGRAFGTPGKEGYVPAPPTVTTRYARKADYAAKLAFVFDENRKELVQAAYPRPWLGMTDQLWEELDLAVKRHCKARKPGSSAPLPPLPRSA